MSYEVKFTPTFNLPKGSVIVIKFPAYFKLTIPLRLIKTAAPNLLHYIKYGLDDISEKGKGYFKILQVFKGFYDLLWLFMGYYGLL